MTTGTDRICANTLCFTSGELNTNVTTYPETLDVQCPTPIQGDFLSIQKYEEVAGIDNMYLEVHFVEKRDLQFYHVINIGD